MITNDLSPCETKQCNICMENFGKENITGLKCNPEKHTFCLDCITDWFITIKNNKNHMIQYKTRECPICRESAGMIPLKEGYEYIKGIHLIPKKKKTVKPKSEDNSECCGHQLVTKNEKCKIKGKPCYNGLCGRHYNLINKKKGEINNP